MGKITYSMDNEHEIKDKDDELSSSSGSRPSSRARPVSALARGVQITEFADSRVNPTPLLLEESDILLEQYLSPGKLQNLTGTDNLQLVESMELKVDSRETSLGNFGALLPNLTELKLSGSNITCARDLGSSLRKLRVLWLTRCALEELDGISSMLSLRELYLEYNELADISPVSMLDKLEILDLEGNNIDDITQVQYLSLCPRLRRLALDGNPICVCPSPTSEEPDYDYRTAVQKILPGLLVLDDERLDAVQSSALKHNVFDTDWAYLEELQQDAFLQTAFEEPETADAAPQGDGPPTTALRAATAYRPGSALRPSSGFRPLSASRRPQSMGDGCLPKPGTAASTRPVSSDDVPGIESTSELTIGGVICGNPSKALRQRRAGGPGSKEEIQKGLSKLLQKGAILSNSDEVDDEPLQPEDEMNNIIDELQSWKKHHEKRMQDIRKTKEAQVLRIDHDEAEDVADSEDDSDQDFPNETVDFRSSSSHRHKADARLKKSATVDASPHTAATDIFPNTAATMDSPPHTAATVDKSPRTADISRKKRSPVDAMYKHKQNRQQPDDEETRHNHRGSPEEYERDGPSPAARGFLSQPPRQSSSRARSREGSMGDVWSEAEGFSSERPSSRGQGEELAPLRAPSPTAAQMISRLRTRHNERLPSPSRSKKLRVGPTGLPNSSQTPVIRTSIIPPRSSLVAAGSSTSMARSGAASLLPSQPRIPRSYQSETAKLLPFPPDKNS